MQVRSDPRAVLKLRCVFLKLRSGLELPLLRVVQAGDPAAPTLQQYYSSALLAYVRKVLEVGVLPAVHVELLIQCTLAACLQAPQSFAISDAASSQFPTLTACTCNL